MLHIWLAIVHIELYIEVYIYIYRFRYSCVFCVSLTNYIKFSHDLTMRESVCVCACVSVCACICVYLKQLSNMY